MIYRMFGLEKAKKDFPQAYSPLEKRKLIKMSNKDSNLPKENIEFEDKVTKILFKELKKQGYVFEADLIELISKKLKITKSTARYNYNKVRADIVNKYDLIRKRNDMVTNNMLKIKGKFTPKVIIYYK